MNDLLIRFRRHYERHGIQSFLPLAILVITAKSKPQLLGSFICLAIVLILAPFPFRHFLINQFGSRFMRMVEYLFVIGSAVAVSLMIFRQPTVACFVMIGCSTLDLGIDFWTETDDMFLMTDWLSHPLEFGRPPDEISHLCDRTIKWGNRLGSCCVYRYGYDTEEYAGITKPLVFSLMESVAGLSTDEIVEQYRSWYMNIGAKVIEHYRSGADQN